MQNSFNRYYIFFFFFLTLTIVLNDSYAGMALMTDEELAQTSGQAGTVEITTGSGMRWEDYDDTWQQYDYARIFMDVHIETGLKIQSAKLGYYHRNQNRLGVSNMSVGLDGYHGYVEERFDQNLFLDVEAGELLNDSLVPAPPADPDHSKTVENDHTDDWDIWIDNISTAYPDENGNVDFSKPGIIDGMIFRADFDDLSSPDPKLQRIIVGTNFRQGNEFLHLHRLSGLVNPNLLAMEAGRSAGENEPYDKVGSAMPAKRDPFVENFRVNVFNLEDRDTGFFLAISNTSGHVGYELIAGFPEAAVDFSYKYGLQGLDIFGDGTTPQAVHTENQNYINGLSQYDP